MKTLKNILEKFASLIAPKPQLAKIPVVQNKRPF